jgi:lysophospholipase L1-like esterase
MNKKQAPQRRQFIKSIAALGSLSFFDPHHLRAMTEVGSDDWDSHTILFQGDSITDGNRTRNNDWNHVMGHGFAYLVASRLWYDFPGSGFHFFNRGISGNKVPDLAARWQTDTIELKPDVLNILVGINDIAALINGDQTFTSEKFEQDYRQLLQQTKEQLPAVQLVLCEPFILPVGKIKDNWDAYSMEIEKRRKVVQKLSVEFDAIFVAFQKAFDKALSKAPADYWIWDGIHPMPAGHELMAREWIKQVGKKLKFIK